MTTLNNWFTTNLKDRPSRDIPFAANFNYSEPIYTRNFYDSSIEAVNLISNKYTNPVLAFSGGIDSHFILKLFKETNLPVTPVLLKTPYNVQESAIAEEIAGYMGYRLVTISMTKDTLINELTLFSNQYNCATLLGSIPILIAKYLKRPVITGNGDPIQTVTRMNPNPNVSEVLEFAEYDFYLDAVEDDHPSAFFTYTPSVAVSFAKEYDYTKPYNTSKAALYRLAPRDKVFWEPEILGMAQEYNRNYTATRISIHRDEFISNFKNVIAV